MQMESRSFYGFIGKKKMQGRKFTLFCDYFFLHWWQIDPKASKPKLKVRFVGRISNPSSISHVCLQILIKPPTVKTWKWRQNLNSQLDLLELSLFSVIYKLKKPQNPHPKQTYTNNKSSKQQLYTIFFTPLDLYDVIESQNFTKSKAKRFVWCCM